MQRIVFLLALCIIFCATTDFRPAFARKNKEIKLENITGSSLELFIEDDNLKQDIATQPVRLNLSFDASSLIKNNLYPTSFKIEIYDTRTSNRNLLGIFRPSIFNAKKAGNFKTELELLNLTQDSDLEIDIFDTNNDLHSSFSLKIEIDNGQTISFTDLTESKCTGSFGKCQLEYIFNNVHLTTLPSSKLQTKIEKNTDGTFTVNLPLFKSKTISVKNKIGSGVESPGADQDFDFDFDGSNLFVIKDGISTLIGAQGPAGEKGKQGDSGSSGAPGSFSGGDASITGILTFVSNGRLQNAVFNGASFVTTSNIAEVPFTIKGSNGQTANLTEWRDSSNNLIGSIGSTGTSTISALTINNSNSSNIGLDVRPWIYIRSNTGVHAGYIATGASVFTSGASATNDLGLRSINSFGISTNNSVTPSLLINTSGTTTLTTASSTSQALIVKGAAGQTANLSEWQDGNGTLLASINKNGSLKCNELDFGNNAGFPRKITPQAYGVLIPANSNIDGSLYTGNNRILLPSHISLAWNTSSPDIAMIRNGAGVLEINSGTTGQYRDLKARKATLTEAMRIEPQPSPPASPSMGDLYVDSDSGELCYYNGSVWTGMVAGGACS